MHLSLLLTQVMGLWELVTVKCDTGCHLGALAWYRFTALKCLYHPRGPLAVGAKATTLALSP